MNEEKEERKEEDGGKKVSQNISIIWMNGLLLLSIIKQ